jgi:predicted lipid carrier protein YhbT
VIESEDGELAYIYCAACAAKGDRIGAPVHASPFPAPHREQGVKAMSESRRRTPPLSPVLVAGLALRPLPPAFLGPALSVAMAAMRRRHRQVFARLEDLADTVILVDPVDLPFCFLVRPGAQPPSVVPLRRATDGARADAIIRGPLLVLIELLEGRLDGDAMFFSRDLSIEGDTEAVLTLRNALDSEDIDVVEDLASFLGPFAAPLRGAVSALGAVFARAGHDLETIRGAFVAPLARGHDRHEARLAELEETVAGLRRQLRRERAAGGRAGKTKASMS